MSARSIHGGGIDSDWCNGCLARISTASFSFNIQQIWALADGGLSDLLSVCADLHLNIIHGKGFCGVIDLSVWSISAGSHDQSQLGFIHVFWSVAFMICSFRYFVQLTATSGVAYDLNWILARVRQQRDVSHLQIFGLIYWLWPLGFLF